MVFGRKRNPKSLPLGKDFIPNPQQFVKQRLAQKGLIEKNRFGLPIIRVPNARLDFKQEFLFKGVTPSGNLKLGEIVSEGPRGIESINVRGILKKRVMGNGFTIRTGKGTSTGFLDLGEF